MAQNKVTCKNCRNVFDWNNQWPEDLKRCPLCGMLVGVNVPPTKIEAKKTSAKMVEVNEISVT
jgi:rRNA maturation endonuclease Nob1